MLRGLFWMRAPLAYCSYARRGGAARYVTLVAAVAGALMAKPMAVTLPCVLLLLDYWPLRRWTADVAPSTALGAARGAVGWRSVLVEKIPLFALSAVAGWLSYLCQQSIGVVWPLADLPLVDRIENAIISYGLYLRRIIFPSDLAVLYPHPALAGAADAHGPPQHLMLSGCILLLLTVVALAARKTRPALLVGWLWFLGVLVPMIGLVQVGEQQLADRYVYVAIIGLGIAVAYAIPRPGSAWTARGWWIGGCCAIIAFAAVTWRQLGYWSDSVTLFARTVIVTHDNSRARLNLGMALHEDGNASQAIIQYQESLRIDSGYALAWYNLGIAYQDARQLESALHCFEQAVENSPLDVDFRLRLGGVRGQTGDLAGAVREFERTRQIDPDSVMALINLGLVFETLGDLDGAIASFQHALDVDPDNEKARHLLAAARERREQAASSTPPP